MEEELQGLQHMEQHAERTVNLLNIDNTSLMPMPTVGLDVVEGTPKLNPPVEGQLRMVLDQLHDLLVSQTTSNSASDDLVINQLGQQS